MRAVLGQVPVLSNLHLAVAKLHQMAGWQFTDVLEGGLRIGNIAEIEVLQQSFRIDLRQLRMHRENRLNLRSKEQPVLMESVMQRLLA